MRSTRFFAVAGFVGFALVATVAARPVAAQSATINVSATVQAPLQLSTLRQLDFTTVFPGLAKTVAPATGGANSATSGQVQIQGQANAEVSVSFVLPVALSDGTNNMPITFGTTSGCHNAANNAAACTVYNPNTALARTLGATGFSFVWLGGTVSPTNAQPAGTYTGLVTMNVAYTGN